MSKNETISKIVNKSSEIASNVKNIMNKAYNINNGIIEMITSGWTIYEIILNILFILLLLLISFIIYWDLINRKVIKTSRCKKQKQLFDKNNGVYKVNVKDKNGNKLLNIQYDFRNKKNNIYCDDVCINGEVVQQFDKIPFLDLENGKDETKTLNCHCDKKYEYNNFDSIIDGEPGLIRYMKNNEKDFFESIKYNV